MEKSFKVTIATLYATSYAALTILQTISMGPLTYGPIQVRLSDALLPTAMVTGIPAAIGLAIGCIIANMYYYLSPLDVVLGSIANFIAAYLSYKFSKGKAIVAGLLSAVSVALIVGTYLSYLFNLNIFIVILWVGVGEFISTVLVGVPLTKALEKAFRDHLRELIE